MSETLYLRFPRPNAGPYPVSSLKPIVAGRSDTCELNLAQYFQASIQSVGREHFKIVYENGQFAILDLGSVNGTRLNGYPLKPDKARVLYDGDKIEIAQDKELTIYIQVQQASDLTRPLLADPALIPILEPLRELRDVVVLGMPGIGKTALLRKLVYHPETQTLPRQPLREHHFLLFCYVNCLAIDDWSLKSFFRHFIAATKPAFREWPDRIRNAYNSLSEPFCTAEEIKSAVLETVHALHEHHEKRLVFLLDQFDDVWQRLPEAFVPLTEIKSIELPVILGIAMRNPFTEASAQVRQFLRAMPARCDCWLPPFPDDRLRELISPYKLEPLRADLALQFGSGQPRLTDLVAASISRLEEIPESDDDLAKQLLQDRGVTDHCREMWHSLLLEEQEALRSIAAGRRRLTPQLESRLGHDKAVIKVTSGESDFANPLLHVFVQSLPPEALASQGGSGLEFDDTSSEFVVEGHRIPHEDLSKLERDMLHYLYTRPNQVCSFFDISADVWGYRDPELAVSTEAIARVVHDLRQKLDEKSPGAGNRYIKNIRGLGYKCVIK